MDDTSRRMNSETESTRAVASGTSEDDDVSRRTVEIRQEIEQTRGEMSETIDAIQEKLRPGNIVANATDRVKNATTEKVRGIADTAGQAAQEVVMQTRDAAGGFAESVRQNPIPAAMIGIGAAWLLMNRGQSRTSEWRDRDLGRREYAYDAERDYQTNRLYQDERTGTYSNVRTRTYANGGDSGIIGRIRNNPVPAALAGIGLSWLAASSGNSSRSRTSGYERAGNFYGDRTSRSTAAGSSGETWSSESGQSGTTEDLTSRAREIASETTGRVREYANDTTAAVRQTSRRAQTQLQRMMQDNPLLVGAGALVLGAAFGLAIPETERENELMGEARDSMVERAQDMARNAASQVQNVAGDAVADVASRVVTGKQE
jgi:ElaB/YqjD/DUF883 family membrane-anchored ribosome-binding protein